jgi:tetratricopeptide (TPR) repeat protein
MNLPTLMPARFELPKAMRLLVLAAGVAASMAAQADEYSDVTQLLGAGRHAEALQKADQFLAARPKDPQMRFLKGVLQSKTGKTSEAIQTFTRLTEDHPELPEPYNNLAVLHADQSQFDKARAALEMAIRTNPSYATAYENLGDVHAKLASQAYSRALQLDSSVSGVQPKLSLIRELSRPPLHGSHARRLRHRHRHRHRHRLPWPLLQQHRRHVRLLRLHRLRLLR